MDIRKFINENKEEIISLLTEMAVNKTQQKKPSVKLKFRALGKIYNSNKTIENYLNFITDLSYIHSYETLKPIMKSFISNNQNDFSKDHKPSVVKVNDNFYITKKLGNDIKEKHINKISEVFNIPIVKI